MNKISRFLLMGALVCGLGLSVTACKDDDEEKVDERIVTEDGKTYVPDSLLTDLERYQLACQSAVISTMRNLAGLESVTPDVVNETHEPTYGMTLDDAGATVRVMKCESTAAAELSFRAIAGLDSADAVRMYTPTADGYQLDLRNMPILPDGKTLTLGTLTFHRDGGPRRHGYVEVDIPCIPHLERIDYLSPDAFPDNAGNSAYQIGDIVRVYSGYSTGYYLCVQPYAYNDGWLVHLCINAPGGDQTVNADGDNEGCWYPYNKTKDSCIPETKETTTYDMTNAYCNFICDHQAKVANIKAFLEGKAVNMKPTLSNCLHHIFPEGFNNDKGVPFVSWDKRDAAIWYDGYVTDDYAYVPAYYYRQGFFCWVSYNVRYWKNASYKYVKDSDWNNTFYKRWNYTMNAIRFRSDPIPNSKLEYSPLNDKLELGVKAEKATKNDVGKCYADDGYLYENALQAQEYGHTPLGIVVFVNYGSEWSKNVVETNNNGGHGLVMSYKEEGKYFPNWEVPDEPYSEDNGYIGNTHESAWNDFSGYDKTQALEYADLKAASLVSDWKPEAPMESSGWFIPTTAQWGAALCSPGLGGASWPNENDYWTKPFSGTPLFTINTYTNTYGSKINLAGTYWTSSAQGASANKGVFVKLEWETGWAFFRSASNIEPYDYVYLRPFLAF